jgi:hypothetical protein
MNDPIKSAAIRTAVEASQRFHGEAERMEWLWWVAHALDVPKDLRPCCPCDDAPCRHNGKSCECWACVLLRRDGKADVDRDPRRQAARGASTGSP